MICSFLIESNFIQLQIAYCDLYVGVRQQFLTPRYIFENDQFINLLDYGQVASQMITLAYYLFRGMLKDLT